MRHDGIEKSGFRCLSRIGSERDDGKGLERFRTRERKIKQKVGILYERERERVGDPLEGG